MSKRVFPAYAGTFAKFFSSKCSCFIHRTESVVWGIEGKVVRQKNRIRFVGCVFVKLTYVITITKRTITDRNDTLRGILLLVV